MKLNEQEAEIISGFLQSRWAEFLAFSREVISINATHRIAEKLNLKNVEPPLKK